MLTTLGSSFHFSFSEGEERCRVSWWLEGGAGGGANEDSVTGGSYSPEVIEGLVLLDSFLGHI